ncbi:alpha/beta hydrolase [Patulibacter sp.]|uniref:alpha/beta hydrolase n=1 Tax=Patulibacter sp. TaxID=1912859 RepID=UPI0027239C5E|nr:alpha/beta hydrolase [Patulibacter sp.]MDO9407627.1 alpha/beta hydrolase [Patulibacter sp.]
MSSVPLQPTVRRFGPPSPQTVKLGSRTRRWWLPVAKSWRMTPRGIRILQRVMDPTDHVPILRGTAVEKTTIGGVRCERVRAKRAMKEPGPGPSVASPAADEPLILYLHGGGYVFGSVRTHRGLVARLSHVTGLPAVSVDYRLPPEWTLPAPIEDALAVYRAVLEHTDASRIVVAGDSAGGNLAHELVLHAAEEGLPIPGALVLLSPWSDLSASGESIRLNAAEDPFIPEIGLRRCARVAVGRADPSDWRVSPLFAPAELQAQLPPTLIQVGAGEVLHDDGDRVARVLAAAGVPATIDVFEGALHVPPAWAGTPEARDALHHIADFVAEHLPGAPSSSRRAADEATDRDADGVAPGPPGAPGRT